MLESLIPIKLAEKKPIELIPLAFLYCSVAILLSLWVFPAYLMSAAIVFLTVMATLPLMLGVIKFEKDKEDDCKGKLACAISCHRDSIPFFTTLFFGMVIAYSFWFIVLPHSTVSTLFNAQLTTIANINNIVTGQFTMGSFFSAILSNNLKVLVVCLVFSFIYGSGAIFILTWNASVISAAIGNTVRTAVSATGMGYFTAFSLGMTRYMTHGIFEIIAYFIAGLAGGMISVAVIRHQPRHAHFKETIKDATLLLIIAVLLLIFAAIIETTISPMVPI